MRTRLLCLFLLTLPLLAVAAGAADPQDPPRQDPNTWVKRSPLPGGPPSPRLGYEAAWGYDPRARVLIRWGGHNQGGGGEQHAETWTFDPRTARWTLHLPNDAPPGVCCAQQNVFDVAQNRFVRFPAFSGSHGWQWSREIYLKNSSVWTYDLAANTWRDRRPVPEPRVSPLRCASWDSDHEVIVVFGGEGNSEGTVVYDPYTNTWTWRQPPEQPAFRSGGNMAYDAARKRHILFGSQFTDDPHTWAYDLRANRWHDLKPATQPPTDRNDAVLTYDERHQVLLAVIKQTEGKDEQARHRLETWAYDSGANTWTRRNPPEEPAPSGSRARLFAYVPDLGLAILESRTHPPQGPAEQQIWTYRYGPDQAAAEPQPAPPRQVRVHTRKDGAELTWKPSPDAGVARYVIQRGEGQQPWEAAYQQVGVVEAGQAAYRDQGLRPGTCYYYAVHAVDAAGRQGPASNRARTQPPLVEDLVASVRDARAVEITWKPLTGPDVVGYHVERAPVEVWTEDQLVRLKKRTPPLAEPAVGALRRIGPFRRLTPAPTQEPRFLDTVDLTTPQKVEGKPVWESRLGKDSLDANGKPYRWAVLAYRVRAVNALGVESGPSPYVLTIPSAPQAVFAREAGTRCDLKWAANPEPRLAGYRIYRLDGRYDQQPVSRLTPEPITGTTFTDPEAGKASRRYHVVAVDALGQEGIPSMPVWFAREWREFYRPFVGEWHQ